MGEKEKCYVEEAFATNWIAPLGPNVDAFEKELSKIIGIKSVLALNSGSAAIHLALQILKLKKNDVVLCQSLTFGASAFPITYCNAEPVFVDSDKETWNMDPVLLEKAIQDCINAGKKPAAIIVVHLYGMPAKIEEIVKIASFYQIPLIEDAAEALGSSFNGKACGSFGDLSILSFNGNKIITTSGGGALLSNDESLIAKARYLSTQAKADAPYYLHNDIGYNYRLSNVLAGIGRGQLEVLNERVEKRRSNFEVYKKELNNFEGIEFLEEPEGYYSNRWLTTILFDKAIWGEDYAEKMRQELEKDNIESRPLWKPLHQQPVFSKCKSYLNGVSDNLFATGLCLPSGSNLTDEKLETVINKFKNFANG
jgi:dTDP-4-amino-4,6-dideoxygalactose transaminase